MDVRKVQSGLPLLGEIPWGTHVCQFYERPEDLLETLVPYFKAGLDGNEALAWVTDQDLSVNAASAGVSGRLSRRRPSRRRRKTCVAPMRCSSSRSSSGPRRSNAC